MSPLKPKQVAKFTPEKGSAVPVHFNPSTLQVTLANTLDTKQGKGPKQFVKDSSATLSVEVVFDTTDSGQNVCDATAKLSAMMAPDPNRSPPNVTFEWGLFKFDGMIATYKETLDFFSSAGVPLRSTVTRTMSRRDKVFDQERGSADNARDVPNGSGQPATGSNNGAPPQHKGVPSTTKIATDGGDPNAGRSIAAANGEESMRFPQSPTLTVDASVPLSPPVAFASASAGLSGGAALGASGGFGVSADAGVGGGAFASFGASTPASAGVGFTVGGASAGVPASQGAFAFLRVPADAGKASALQVDRLVAQSTSYDYATDEKAKFDLGGRAMLDGSGGLSANANIQFDASDA
jgi:Contractile injection system tube protein